jgi:hypothetical protein
VVPAGTQTAAEKLGMLLVGWTADSEDWRGGDADGMLARLRPGIGPGAILMRRD